MRGRGPVSRCGGQASNSDGKDMIQQNGVRAFGTPSKKELLLFDKIVTVQWPTGFEPENAYLQQAGILVQEDLVLKELSALLPFIFNAAVEQNRSGAWTWILAGTICQLLGTYQEGIEGLVTEAFQQLNGPLMETYAKARPHHLRAARGLMGIGSLDMAQVIQLIQYGAFLTKFATMQNKLQADEAAIFDCATRVAGLLLKEKYGGRLTGVLTKIQTLGPQDKSARTEELFDLILSKFPIPNASVPLQDIVEFRKEAKTQELLLQFRYWMNKVMRSEVSPTELDDEIEFLMNEYSRCMKHAKMKYRLGTIRVIATLPAEFVENVVRLRFRNAVEAIFKLVDRKVELIEAKSSAPGRELSYILLANERFSDG
jgi:hypothetical protein